MSVVQVVPLGSALSLRSIGRLGSSFSVFDFTHMGSSMSLRWMGRLGSTVSLFGMARLGGSLSLLDYLHVGSSLSVRGIARLGQGLSLVGNIRGPQQLIFSSGTTYISENSGSSVMEFYVGNSKAMTVESDGGILHGSWNSENVFVTSDRRLKKEINPLQRTLRSVMPGRDGLKVAKAGDMTSGDGALWLLRQLRPVSYSFKKGAESKYMRFGFIADELESVVPQVVRTMGDREVPDQKAVVYQDLIALLAAAAQSQQKAMEDLKQSMGTQLEELRAQVEALQQVKKEQEVSELRALRAEIEKMKEVRNETAELEELKALRDEIERLKQDEIESAKGLPQHEMTRGRTLLRGA